MKPSRILKHSPVMLLLFLQRLPISNLFSSLLLTTWLMFHCNMIRWSLSFHNDSFLFFLSRLVVWSFPKNQDGVLLSKPKTPLSISFFSRQKSPYKMKTKKTSPENISSPKIETEAFFYFQCPPHDLTTSNWLVYRIF